MAIVRAIGGEAPREPDSPSPAGVLDPNLTRGSYCYGMAAASLSDGIITRRPWHGEDAPAIVECIDGDPEITRWLDRVPQPYSLEDAEAYIGGRGKQAFAVVENETGRVLGSIGFGPVTDGVGEIGYWLRADARDRGVTTRALVLL